MARKQINNIESWLDEGIHVPTRTFLIAGDIDDDMVTYVAQRVHVLNADNGSAPTTVLLNSNGGNVDAALVIYDLLSSLNGNLTIRVVGSAMSSAAVILQAGDVRELTPNSSVMYHPGTSGLESTPTPESETMWRFWKQMNKRCDDIVHERMVRSSGRNISATQFRTRVIRGLVGIGSKAVALGLADYVIGDYPNEI